MGIICQAGLVCCVRLLLPTVASVMLVLFVLFVRLALCGMLPLVFAMLCHALMPSVLTVPVQSQSVTHVLLDINRLEEYVQQCVGISM